MHPQFKGDVSSIDPSRIEVVMLYRVDEGVGDLLEESAEDCTSTGSTLDLNLPFQSSLQTTLFELAHRTMDYSEELFFESNKGDCGNRHFPSKGDENKLRKDINVEFVGKDQMQEH